MATFNQVFNAPINTVVNGDGITILTSQSSKQDLASAIASVQKDAKALEELHPEERVAVEKNLEAAKHEAAKPAPEKSTVVEKLNTAKGIVEGISATTKSTIVLGKTIGSIAAWVTALLI